MKKRIIPPSQRNSKNYLWDALGGIGLVEIAIVTFSILVSLIIFFTTTIKIGFFISIVLIVFSVILIKTDSKSNLKGYESFLRWFNFLSSKKSYSSNEVKKLLSPFEFDDENERIRLSKSDYINIIKIDGRDIEKLSFEERDLLINSYAEILKNSDVNLHFYKEIVEPDNAKQINSIKKKIEEIENETIKDSSKKIIALKQLNGYLIEEQAKTINKKIEYKLVLVGSADDVFESTNHLIEDLKSININSNVIDYEKQKYFIEKFYNLFSDENEKTTFHRNHVKQGKEYARFISIGKKPLYANDAWFASFCFFDNVIPSLKFLQIKDQDLANKNLDRAIQHNEIKSTRIGRTSTKQKSELITINEIYREIIEGINSDSDRMIDILPLFMIKGTSISELNKTERALKKVIKADGFNILSLPNIQFHSFETFMPKRKMLLRNQLSIEVPSITAASSFPFIVDDFIDDKGIYLSETSQGGEIYWNNEIRDDYRFNSNAIILGSSGSGKSVTTYKLVLNDYLNGNKIFIIDPEQEYLKLVDELGGKILDMGGNGKYKINPLVIPKSFESNETNHLQQHISFLKSFFETTNSTIKQDASIIIQKELIDFYKTLKITDESITNSYSTIKWPIFDDFYNFLEMKMKQQSGNIRDIYEFASIIISQYASGGTYSNLWNNHQKIDFDERIIVFDTSTLINDKHKIAGQMLFITKIIWTAIQENKKMNERMNLNKYASLYIDEAHLLMNKNNLFALEWIQMVTKRIRKYNGKMFLITQNVKDFLGDKEIAHYTEGIINNISYSFIGKMQPKDLESLDNMYSTTGGLTETEKNWIIQSGRGKFLLKIGDRLKYFIERVHINPIEAELFSKDILKSFDHEYIETFNLLVNQSVENKANENIQTINVDDEDFMEVDELMKNAVHYYEGESLEEYISQDLIELLDTTFTN